MECLGNTYKYTTATPIRNRLFFTSLRFDFVFFFVIFWRFSVAGAPTIGRFCCDWMRSPFAGFGSARTRTNPPAPVQFVLKEKKFVPWREGAHALRSFFTAPQLTQPQNKTQ